MKAHSYHRPCCLLSVLSSWRRITIPLAVILVVVQSFGMLYGQVQAAEQSYGSAVPIADLPIPLAAEFAADPAPASGGQMAMVGGNLVSDDQRAAVMAEATAAQFRLRAGENGSVVGANRNNRFDLAYSAEGMLVSPQRSALDLLQQVAADPEWQVRISAQSLACDSEIVPLHGGPASPAVASGDRLSAELAPGCREWYVNRAGGLEHGFTIEDPAVGSSPPERVSVTLAVETNLSPVLEDGAIHFQNPHANSVLLYRDLHVFDDTGRELPSSMNLQDSPGDGEALITLTADTQGAVFPITIDPVVATPDGSPMMAPGAVSGEQFGYAVAAHGNWFISTVPERGNGQAMVYGRDQGGTGQWGLHSTLQVPLEESPGTNDRFGFSAAIDEDPETGQQIIAIGAPDHAGCGAVFLFVLVATAWVFLTKLQPNDLLGGDKFGCAVSLWGTFLAVGAYLHGFNGAAYVFSLIAAVWTLFQKVTVISAGAGAEVGRSVAITIRNLLLGAPAENSGEGAAYLFTRLLVAGALFAGSFFRLFSDKAAASVLAAFGFAVAMTLTMIAIGGPGIDTNGTTTLTDRGGVTLFAFIAATATWIFLKGVFGSVAGGMHGHSVDLNHDNDLAVGRPGSVVGALGGVILIYLFNRIKFVQSEFFNSYDAPTTVSPPVTPDPGMQFGHAVVLIGALLFVAAVAYSLSLGVVFRFLLTVVALTFAAWQLLFFTQAMIDNPALQHLVGATGDYSGDGIPNMLKWAMGLLPIIFNANPLRGRIASNGFYLLTIPVSLIALNVLFIIQYSTGLGSILGPWLPISLGPLAAQIFLSFAELGITSNVLIVSIALAAALTLFFRVSVNQT